MGFNPFTQGLLSLFGGGDKDEPQLPKPPEYYEDPNYRQVQDFLKQYGMDLLGGKPNDYYGEIGSYGGAEFEKMLGLSNRDIQQSAAEAAARTGRGRGGSLPSVTAQMTADNTSKLRYADYLKAMEGRKSLLNTGVGITEGVRNTSQAEGGARNAFNMKSYDYTRRNELFDIDRGDQESAAFGDMLANLFNIGTGAAVGGMTGGVPGALIGAAGGVGSLAEAGALDKIFGVGKSTTTNLSSATPGVSSLGKIKSGSDIDDFLAQYSKRFTS